MDSDNTRKTGPTTVIPSQSLVRGGTYRHSSRTNILERFKEMGFQPPSKANSAMMPDADKLAALADAIQNMAASSRVVSPTSAMLLVRNADMAHLRQLLIELGLQRESEPTLVS